MTVKLFFSHAWESMDHYEILAEELTRLRAENEKLREQVEELTESAELQSQGIESQHDVNIQQRFIIGSLRTENEKLRELRLFVWNDFYHDYTNGLAVVIAPDLHDAQKLLIKHGWTFTGGWGDVKEFPLNEPHVFAVAGGG